MAIFLVLACVPVCFAQTDFSIFYASKVLQDACFRSRPYDVVSTPSVITCSHFCSSNKNCKRFMACLRANLFECSLFYEGANCEMPTTDGCSCFRKIYSRSGNETVCPLGLYGDKCENVITDCSDGAERGMTSNNVWWRLFIKPRTSTTVFEVVCELRFGGYTLLMFRSESCKDVSFNRNITEYIRGFGDSNGDYWLGLERMKQVLDNHRRNKLSVILIKGNDFKENFYDNFRIGGADVNYTIHVGMYEYWTVHKCGDSLTGEVNIEGSPFSAPGSDHTSFNCAGNLQAGWWFANHSDCSDAFLTGSKKSIIWRASLGNDPQAVVALTVRPYIEY